MKYSKEWHTCDRCGAEINENERSMFLKRVYRISGLLARKYAFEKVNEFDLCHKCREEFERFMRNEKPKSKIIIKTREDGYIKIYANGKWQKKVTDIDFHADCNGKGISYINVNCQFEKYVCDKNGVPIVSNGNTVKEHCIAKI